MRESARRSRLAPPAQKPKAPGRDGAGATKVQWKSLPNAFGASPTPTKALSHPSLERPPAPRQFKCAACGGGSPSPTPCPRCESAKLATPASGVQPKLATPPSSEQSTAPTREQDPAERQADALGTKIGSRLASAGSVGHGPLPESVREVAESELGVDLGGTELRNDGAAQAHTTRLNAHAVAEGSTVSFANGALSTASAAGRSLLGHELTHVAQQRAAGIAAVQGDSGAGGGAGFSPSGAEGTGGGPIVTPYPCTVTASALSNTQLLMELNNSRAYLHTHTWGDDETYDWANLLRRLNAERQLRIQAGQLWLAERGLLNPPPVLYTLNPTSATMVAVQKIDGGTVAGAPTGQLGVVMTPQQFDVFLALQGIQTVDPNQYFATRDPNKQEALSLELKPAERRGVMPPPFKNPLTFLSDPEREIFSVFYPHFDPIRAPDPFTPAPDPFGLMGAGPFGAGTPYSYTPSAGQVLGELGQMPGTLSGYGPELIHLPPSAATPAEAPALPAWDNPEGFFPQNDAAAYGLGGLGFLGQPPAPLPEGTAGVLVSEPHLSNFAVGGGRMMTRGFRAGLSTHAFASLGMLMGGRGASLQALNRGVPGTYANDAIFPFHPLAPGVVVFRKDGGLVSGDEMAKLMADAEARIAAMPPEERIYRFSSPKPGSRAFRSAFPDAPPDFCPPGANNCINQPDVFDLHERAVGEGNMRFEKDGQIIDLSDPKQASARNARAWAELPDDFFEQRGLVRQRIRGQMLGGLGMSTALGVGASVASDLWHGQTPQTSSVLTAAGSSASGVIAENYMTNRAMLELVRRGVPLSTAGTAGRFIGGTGAAVVIAPITTGLTMAFDDRAYTQAEYAGAMGRSAVGAGGGAIATGLYFAAVGSVVPGAGTAVGFLVGAGGFIVGSIGFYLTDLAFGESVEQGIRVGMGELGCDD